MTALTGFYLHPSASLHDTGWGHPEHQGRLRALASTVGRDLLTLHGHVEQQESPEATEEELLRVHSPGHIKLVREMCVSADVQQKVLDLDPDTKVSGASWEAAVGSAGAAIAAVSAVADGDLASAFVACRPPGHHATPDRAMGFCLVNNVAVAARHLQATGRAERVLIVDWDVHHGNGTQDTFYADPTVFFLSLHQAPHFPGTGSKEQTGEGKGEGFTLNVPMPAGTSRESYRARFREALEESATRIAPDFVLVSSGFDCLADDPLGGFLLEPEDLYQMAREVVELADTQCGGKVAAVLEGGYEPSRVGVASLSVIRALAGLPDPES
jgi:acetoin utilization deacetylase AcuC-like enzyme